MVNTSKLLGEGIYAYLLSDAAFKVVVCTPENEKLLIEILELLIPGKHIERITFINKEMHGLVITEKNVNFDLLCKDKDTGEGPIEAESHRSRQMQNTTGTLCVLAQVYAHAEGQAAGF